MRKFIFPGCYSDRVLDLLHALDGSHWEDHGCRVSTLGRLVLRAYLPGIVCRPRPWHTHSLRSSSHDAPSLTWFSLFSGNRLPYFEPGGQPKHSKGEVVANDDGPKIFAILHMVLSSLAVVQVYPPVLAKATDQIAKRKQD